MSVVDDAAKLKLMDVVKKVEALQDALNKESITSIDLVKSSSRRPVFDLKQAIAAIIGDDGSKKEAPPEESGKDPLDDGFGGAGGN